MKRWLKRIRGAFGTALTWAIAWSGVGATLGLVWPNSGRGVAASVAAGSLALAGRADDRELLDASADVADIGLTEEEKRELLAG